MKWTHSYILGRVETLDAKYNLVALFELLVCPHEVGPWLYSWFSNDDVEGSMPLERLNKAI